MNMTYSRDGLHLTEFFEGCRLSAYPDPVGVWTIGYGHTWQVKQGMKTCIEEAEQWLMEDVQRAAKAVNTFVHVPLTQHEFDALVDFTFNLGTTAFRDSTMLKLLNQGEYWRAADEFLKWTKAGGHILAGLLLRRKAERQEFMTPDNQPVPPPENVT